MSEDNFAKELQFVTSVANALAEQMGQSRLSVITFSDDAKMAIPLTMYSLTSEFTKKVLDLPWIGGNTYTDKALEMMYKQFDAFRTRGRRSVGVVITDGGSTDPFRTLSVIKKIKEKGINMFAIGKNKTNLKLKTWIDSDDTVIFFYSRWLRNSDKESSMVSLSIKILIKKHD